MCKSSKIQLIAVLSLALNGLAAVHVQGASDSVEPNADQLLRKMADYLGGLKQFTVQIENTLDVVLPSGEKIAFDIPAEASVRRPDRLHARRTGGDMSKELYYDGKTVTLYDPESNYYALVSAPPTLEAALDYARIYFDLYAPGGDLLCSNVYDLLMEDVVSGRYVGLSAVSGVSCHHLAYRGNEVDWQIWIEDGDRPLPRKFVITTKWMTGAPQFTLVVRNWDLSPKLRNDTFTFVPPKGSEPINFIPLTTH